jgi:hypothetical protein
MVVTMVDDPLRRRSNRRHGQGGCEQGAKGAHCLKISVWPQVFFS